jgi:hypothetical protein
MMNCRTYAFGLILVLLTCACIPARVSAQFIEARRQYLDAEFEEAWETFHEALEAPTLTREEVAQAHRYLAMLAFVLRGDESAAAEHAAAAVALDPAATAPEGAPPAVEGFFARFRRELGGRSLQLTITSSSNVDGVRVTARLEPVVLPGLVERIELQCVSNGSLVEQSAAPPEASVSITGSGVSHCHARASSPGGTTLLQQREEVLGATSVPNHEVEQSDDTVWIVLAIVGVSVLAAGGITAGILLSESSRPEPFLNGPTVLEW